MVDYDEDLTVILDNSTRWNSAFLSIQRGLRLKVPIKIYVVSNETELERDKLSDEDWRELEAIAEALKPFHDVSLRIQGDGEYGAHGVIWEALTSLDYLLTEVESKRDALQAHETDTRRRPQNSNNTPRSRVNPLLIAYQNSWEKLQEYNNLTDNNHEIYAAGTLLNPYLRKAYFMRRWTGAAADYIEPMIKRNRTQWETQYRQNTPIQAPVEFRSPLAAFMAGTQQGIDADEFTHYLEAPPLKFIEWKDDDHNIFHWWKNSGYDTLCQMAFDVLSIPATSAEMERAFASAKRTITYDRNSLSVHNFERLQTHKH
jgi:hypothetical protein